MSRSPICLSVDEKGVMGCGRSFGDSSRRIAVAQVLDVLENLESKASPKRQSHLGAVASPKTSSWSCVRDLIDRQSGCLLLCNMISKAALHCLVEENNQVLSLCAVYRRSHESDLLGLVTGDPAVVSWEGQYEEQGTTNRNTYRSIYSSSG